MKRTLVTGCNLAFAPGAAAALRSCRAYNPDVARFCYAPPSEIDAVQRAIGDTGTVIAAPRVLEYVPDHWKPQLMAARVFMAHLPGDVTAWIDSDAIFCAPSPELWDVKPGRVHAIQDAIYNLGRMVPAPGWEGFSRAFGSNKTDPGFNSGVMALRNEDWKKLPEQFENAVARVGYQLYPHGFDQPLLNGILLPYVDWLPRPFNAHATFELGVPDDVRILHFTDSPKPWMKGFNRLQKANYLWVLHGLQEARPLVVAGAKVRAAMSGPATLAYKVGRKVALKLGLYHPTPMGVHEDGSFLTVRPGVGEIPK